MRERRRPIPKRSAIVTRRMEKAHGLILSRSADTTTRGKSHVPPPEIFHRTSVPACDQRINTAPAAITIKSAVRIIIFFVMLGCYERGKTDTHGCSAALFNSDYSLNFTDTRRPVRSGVKHNFYFSRSTRRNFLVELRNKAVPRHAIRTV